VSGNPATPAGAIPGAGVLGASADHAAPRLTLSLRGGSARLHGTAVALPFRCNETCVARAHGTISVRGSARVHRLRGASRLLRRGQSGALVVHVPHSALGSIHRALRAGRTVRCGSRCGPKTSPGTPGPARPPCGVRAS
jgi:hypothetical protein